LPSTAGSPLTINAANAKSADLRAFARRAGHRIVGVFKETASGAKNDRFERKKVMALAQAREIDAVLVTELSRWGRSTQDLVQTLDDLHSWKVSVLAQTGLSFDLSTASGKLMRTIMAGLAEFERDLVPCICSRQELAPSRSPFSGLAAPALPITGSSSLGFTSSGAIVRLRADDCLPWSPHGTDRAELRCRHQRKMPRPLPIREAGSSDLVKSGLAAARARGVVLGRQDGQRPSDRKAKKVLAQHKEGLSYRLIGRNLGLSKNTVMEIVRREAD
jgi:DNA invertase Pin-like site-specific DNA recombinase